MLITPADTWFSKCVRERAAWCCEICGRQYDQGSQGLHCSHYFGRGNWATRYYPDNANAHCYGCHQQMEGNPHKFREWKEAQLGPERYSILLQKSNDPMLGKQARREKGEIAKHYKAEYERMLQLRAQGVRGELAFTGW